MSLLNAAEAASRLGYRTPDALIAATKRHGIQPPAMGAPGNILITGEVGEVSGDRAWYAVYARQIARIVATHAPSAPYVEPEEAPAPQPAPAPAPAARRRTG